MPKRKVKLEIVLPSYPEPKTTRSTGRPGMAWRKRIYQSIQRAAEKRDIESYEGTSLECDVILYMTANQLKRHDIDNLLKHIFDALQGRLGGPKAGGPRQAVLPNDYQIKRVCVEKREARSTKLKSRLIVRDYVKAQRTRSRSRRTGGFSQ